MALSAVLPPFVGTLPIVVLSSMGGGTLFSSSSREVGELDGDKRNDLTDRLDHGDDPDSPAVHNSSDDDRYCKMDLTDRTGVVVWEDSTGQMQHTSELRMDLHVDAPRDRAIFVLHGSAFVKGGKPNKVNLYLFIHPEHVDSVEFNNNMAPPQLATQAEPARSFISLRFTMTQPPSLVAPKNRPLVPKARSEGLLDTMKALALVQNVTIYLSMLQLLPEIRHQLSLLPLVFLFNDLKTDERWATIQRLYHGAGGEVIKIGQAVAAAIPSLGYDTPIQQTLEPEEDSLPPPYVEKSPLQGAMQVFASSGGHVQTSFSVAAGPGPSSRKRRRTSEPSSASTTHKQILLNFGQVVRRNAELEIRVERLEKMLQESGARTPCRYNTEEVEHIMGHVNDRIDDQLTGVHIELEDKVMEGTERLLEEKTEETQRQLWDGIRDGLREEMREDLMEEMREELKEHIRDELIEKMRNEVKQELMAELKMEFFREMAQSMMSMASGSNEKARMSLENTRSL